MVDILKTQLAREHERLGAKMVDFGGWWMPIRFAGIIEEHLAVRAGVGLFDVSHMGEILITGPDATEFIDHLVTNNVARLTQGQAMYTCLCLPSGGIVDDLLVYCLDNGYLLVVNAANIDKDYDWILRNRKGNVEIQNRSSEYFQLALQGPRACEVLAPLTDVSLEQMGFYHFAEGKVAGMDAIVSRTGYTGEDGFEIYAKGFEEEAAHMWHALLKQGKDLGIVPAGLGARDTLRLEMGYCLYGNDLTEETTPLEAGLGWVTKLKKGPFIGREVLLDQKTRGLKQRLVGFMVEGRSAPRHGYQLLFDGEVVGEVTSGGFSPSLERGIGLGYVPTDLIGKEGQLSVSIRGKKILAEKVKLPFYKQGSHL